MIMRGNMFKKINYYMHWKEKKLRLKCINTLDYYIYKKDLMFVAWWNKDGGINWGDALNPVIISKLSKKKVIHYKDIFRLSNLKVHSVIGSILGIYNVKNLIVWGSGYISSSSTIRKDACIHAVRGPLTREKLISQGINCPEVYGDPALLYPLFYKPPKSAKYKLGIIPHFIDKDNPYIEKYTDDPNVIIIDVMGDINIFIDQICSCQVIASSSLHGLIAADAYGISSIWIEFSDKIRGKHFKYQDYFASVGRFEDNPLFINNEVNIEDILHHNKDYTINIDLIKLLKSCPFIETKEFNSLAAELKSMVMKKYIKNDAF